MRPNIWSWPHTAVYDCVSNILCPCSNNKAGAGHICIRNLGPGILAYKGCRLKKSIHCTNNFILHRKKAYLSFYIHISYVLRFEAFDKFMLTKSIIKTFGQSYSIGACDGFFSDSFVWFWIIIQCTVHYFTNM